MILYGKQTILTLVAQDRERLVRLMLAKEIDKKLFSTLSGAGVPIERLDGMKAQALARGGNHQGFLAEITPPEWATRQEIRTKGRILVLDRVSDVGNIGSLCRSAWCLGFEAVVLGGAKSAEMPGIIRSSAGAALKISLAPEPMLPEFLHELRQAGYLLLGAESRGKELVRGAHSRVPALALVLGSEGEGIGARVRKMLDETVSLSLERDFDSLNVSVAGAIIMDRIRDARPD